MADARVSLEQIDSALGDYAAPADWLGRAQNEKQAWNAHLDECGQAVSSPPAYNQVIHLAPESAVADQARLALRKLN